MLQTIRDRATGWIAYVIVGLLVIPFALWGINEYFGPGVQYAAEVGDVKIGINEYQRAYQGQRQQVQEMLGGSYDPATFDEAGLRRDVLEGLVNEALLAQAARSQGYRISDRQLQAAVAEVEAFQRDGVFDRERYQGMLRAQGYDPVGFEQRLRTTLSTSQMREGVVNSAFVTDAEVRRLVALAEQQRAVAYLRLDAASRRDTIAPGDAEIEAYYQANLDTLRTPERVRVQYLELDIEALAAEIPVDESAVAAHYEQTLGRYGREEERVASHILVKTAEGDASARAAELAAELAAGKDFEQIGSALAADPLVEQGDLGVIGKGMMDPAFEAALFALAEVGDVSAPVVTPYGVHLIRLDDIRSGDARPLAEVREQVIADLRRAQAEARYYERAETLANQAYENPESLEPAAQALGLTVHTSEWFTRSGGAGIAADPRVVSLAFSDEVRGQGYNSEPLELAPGRAVVVRVAESQAAATLTLEQAREQIVARLREQAVSAALSAEAEALRARLAAGEPAEALADGAAVAYSAPVTVTRRGNPDMPQAVVDLAFRLGEPAPGEMVHGVTELGNGDQAVVLVSEVTPGSVEGLEPAQLQGIRERLAARSGGFEFQALLSELRAQTRIITNADRL